MNKLIMAFAAVAAVLLPAVRAAAEGCSHEWGAWSADTATKLAGGVQTRHCTKCTEVDSRQTPQRWDYLKTDGKGYFKTGYVPNLARTEFKMNVRFHASAINDQRGLLVANEDIAKHTKQYGNAINLNVQGYDPQNNFDYYNSNNGGSFYPPFDGDTTKAHEIVILGNRFWLDDRLTEGNAMAAADVLADSELYFLATHSAGAQETRRFADCDVYGFALSEVTDGGATTNLVHKYRPAKNGNDATLWDEVTGTYLAVTGSDAAFTVGNDTEPEEPTIDEEPDAVPETAYDAEHTIVCYGDSLTEGDCADYITYDGRENFFDGRLEGVNAEAGYPWWLANSISTDYNVIAQARSGMCSDFILGWQGGLKLRLRESVTLPAEADTPVPAPNALVFGGDYRYAPAGWKWEMSHGDVGDKWLGCGTPVMPSTDTQDKCDCDSVTGVLTGWICGKRVRLRSSHNLDMTISRVVAGEEPLTLPAGATFTPDPAKLWPNRIHVILAGANDGIGQIDRYVADIKRALTGVSRYIVISQHCSWDSKNSAAFAAKFVAAFGEEHYINLYEKMSKQGLATAVRIGAMTSAEAAATTWNAGDGSGLLHGSEDSYTHFNTRGYKVLAAFVKEKLEKLGYVPSQGGPREPGPRTWTGAAGDGVWESDGNWSPAGAPEATEDVTLDSSIGDIDVRPYESLPKGRRTITLTTDGEHHIDIQGSMFSVTSKDYEDLTLSVSTKPGENGWVSMSDNGLNMYYGVLLANLDGNRIKFNVFRDNTAGSEIVIDNGASFACGYSGELGNQPTKMTLKGDSYINAGSLITLKGKFQLTLVPTPDLEKKNPYLNASYGTSKFVIEEGLKVKVDVSAFAKRRVTRTYAFMKSASDSEFVLPTAEPFGEGVKDCTVTFTSPDSKTILMTVKSAPKGLLLLVR